MLALMGVRHWRTVTPADNVYLTLDGTNRAIARCLIVSGGTKINLVAADDQPGGTAGAGGPCVLPLGGGVVLIPSHTSQVWLTNTDAVTVVAGF